MEGPMIQNSLTVFLCTMAAFVSADAPQSSKQQKTPPPVALAVQQLTQRDSNWEIAIQLDIREGFEVYSQHKSEWLMPLKINVVDADHKTINATFKYPKAKMISAKEIIGDDYYVYNKKPKIRATCVSASKPAYINLSYHGYHTSGY